MVQNANMIETLERVGERRDAAKILIKDLAKTLAAPADKRLILSSEGRPRIENPDWNSVEIAIQQIDPGHGNSFCILENPDRGFVQALCGFNGYHLEWSEGNSGCQQHWRASFPGASAKRVELKKHDRVSGGEYGDLLPIEEVIDTFKAYYRSTEKPAWLTWRPVEL